VRPQLCEINHSSAIWLHSFVFLLVFSICRQGLSLLGEVDRATPVDNQRSRGAAIAGFRAELFGSRIELCRDSTKSRVIRTFRKIGIPSSHHIWWSHYRSTLPPNVPIAWDQFKAAFRGNYIPPGLMAIKHTEFMRLSQGNKSLTEYL
jgi:hypothetical protein